MPTFLYGPSAVLAQCCNGSVLYWHIKKKSQQFGGLHEVLWHCQLERVWQRKHCVMRRILHHCAAEGDNLYFSKKADQLDLLAQVLMAGEDEAGEEADTAEDDVSKTAKAVARRTAGSMSKISGATGNYYMEFGTGEKAIAQYGRGQGSKRGRPDVPKPKPINKQSLTYKYNR